MAPLPGPQPGALSTPARLAPTPIGVAADVGEGWKVTVNGAASDITDAVIAENQFNELPPERHRFVGVNVTYSYDGASAASGFAIIDQCCRNLQCVVVDQLRCDARTDRSLR